MLKLFGDPVGLEFHNGDHWVPFFCDFQVAPGPRMPLIMDMPGEVIATQDGKTIYFGVKGDGVPSNALEYNVVNASLYIGVPEVGKMLQKEWLVQGRLFFSQLSQAVGVNSTKGLFEDFVALPRRGEIRAAREYAEFERKLADTKFGPANTPLFSGNAVRAIIANCGHIAEEVAKWGIGNLDAQTPNIRQNPAADAAADSRITRLTGANSMSGITASQAWVASILMPQAGSSVKS